jgi:hypothetical protein
MALLDEALDASECVISVMGAHADEDADAIFGRKIDDCETVGRTFWVAKSAKARPAQVQAICNPGRGGTSSRGVTTRGTVLGVEVRT